MARTTIKAVTTPNLGVYYDRPAIAVPEQGLADCRNVRITEGKLTNFNVGWTRFGTWQLNGRVTLIDNHFSNSGAQKLIFASDTDLYEWVEGDDSLLFLTPRYETGTVTVSGAIVTGTGTTWDTSTLRAGDAIYFGATGQRDPDATWHIIDSVDSATQITLEASASTIGSPTPYTVRLRMQMGTDDSWSTELFQYGLPGPYDYWIGTNGREAPYSWDGNATQVTRHDAFGFTCRVVRRFSNMMLYGVVSDGGTIKRANFRTSAIGEPFNVTTKEADEFRAYANDSEILNMQPIGEALAIYGARCIALATYVGPPLMLALRTVITGVGLLAADLLVDYGDVHEFLGPDTAYEFDGVTLKETHAHVMREVLRRHSPNRLGQAQAHFNEEMGIVYWVVPLTTDPTDDSPSTAFCCHYLEPVDDNQIPFTVCDLPATATGYWERQSTLTWDTVAGTWQAQAYRWDDRFFQGAFPLNLFGDALGKVYTLATSESQDGAAISSWARTGIFATVNGMHKGMVTRVQPFADAGVGTLGVKVHTADQMGGVTTEAGTWTYDLEQPVTRAARFVYPFTPARYHALEFGTNGVGKNWTLEGWSWEVRRIGEG